MRGSDLPMFLMATALSLGALGCTSGAPTLDVRTEVRPPPQNTHSAEELRQAWATVVERLQTSETIRMYFRVDRPRWPGDHALYTEEGEASRRQGAPAPPKDLSYVLYTRADRLGIVGLESHQRFVLSDGTLTVSVLRSSAAPRNEGPLATALLEVIRSGFKGADVEDATPELTDFRGGAHGWKRVASDAWPGPIKSFYVGYGARGDLTAFSWTEAERPVYVIIHQVIWDGEVPDYAFQRDLTVEKAPDQDDRWWARDIEIGHDGLP